MSVFFSTASTFPVSYQPPNHLIKEAESLVSALEQVEKSVKDGTSKGDSSSSGNVSTARVPTLIVTAGLVGTALWINAQ